VTVLLRSVYESADFVTDIGIRARFSLQVFVVSNQFQACRYNIV